MFSKSLTKALGVSRFGTLSPSTLTQIHSHSARLISAQAKAAIDDAVKADPIVVFMKGNVAQPQCGFSKAVCQILEVQGVPPEKIKTYNVLDDPELRDAIKEYSEWPTIPQVYLNGEFVGGCDIFLGMHQSGELEDLLVKEKIISLESPPPVADSSLSESSETKP